MGRRLPKSALKLVADLMQSKQKEVVIEYVDIQEQRGASDCGLFALAFITSICNGIDPASYSYQQAAMRSHTLSCIEKSQMTLFPCISGRQYQESIKKTLPVYYVCRLPNDGSSMIQCCECKECYHLACVNVIKEYLIKPKLDWHCTQCI